MEEGGVIGQVLADLGWFEHEKNHNNTNAFLLRVTEEVSDYEESAERKRIWVG